MNSATPIIKMAVVGDVMPGAMRIPLPEIDAFRTALWKPMEDTELVVANLECPITAAAHPRADKRFNFKSSPDTLLLFDSRFVLSLANNHIMDFGGQGLADTLQALRSRRLAHAGAGMNLDEAGRPAIIASQGMTIGVICAADPRFEPASDTRPGTFPADPDILRAKIQEVRPQVDILLVSIHMGIEYLAYPNSIMLRLAEICRTEGVRIVFFHHSHRLGGWTAYPCTLALWGTGNYLFSPEGAEPFSLWFRSAAWRMNLSTKGDPACKIQPVPVVIARNGVPARAPASDDRRITETIARLSARTASGWRRSCWSFAALWDPRFLYLTLKGYVDIGRRRGWHAAVRVMLSTLNTQFQGMNIRRNPVNGPTAKSPSHQPGTGLNH